MHFAARNRTMHSRGKFSEKMTRSVVLQGVRGVEPQSVQVVLVKPMQRILDEEATHHVAVFAVEVQSASPGRLMALGEIIRTVHAQVVAVRTEVVVHYVEQHGQAQL